MTRETLKTILLVEDDLDIQSIAKMALRQVGGFTIETCSSGAEALQKAPQFNPQLILLDVMMPLMDGPTTLVKIRENPSLANIPVIFLTAKAQAHEIEEYKKLGALDVIIKPFDPMKLASTVLSIWNR